MNNNYIFEEEEQNPLERDVETTLLKAIEYISNLLKNASNKLICGQYELYLKDFAFLKYIFNKMSDLQDIYTKVCDHTDAIRPSDVEAEIEEIMSHIREYEIPENESNTLGFEIAKNDKNPQQNKPDVSGSMW